MQPVLGKQSGKNAPIFPYDGMNRIRSAGQGVCSPNLSRKHPTPRRKVLFAVEYSITTAKGFVKYDTTS